MNKLLKCVRDAAILIALSAAAGLLAVGIVIGIFKLFPHPVTAVIFVVVLLLAFTTFTLYIMGD